MRKNCSFDGETSFPSKTRGEQGEIASARRPAGRGAAFVLAEKEVEGLCLRD